MTKIPISINNKKYNVEIHDSPRGVLEETGSCRNNNAILIEIYKRRLTFPSLTKPVYVYECWRKQHSLSEFQELHMSLEAARQLIKLRTMKRLCGMT